MTKFRLKMSSFQWQLSRYAKRNEMENVTVQGNKCNPVGIMIRNYRFVYMKHIKFVYLKKWALKYSVNMVDDLKETMNLIQVEVKALRKKKTKSWY